MSQAVITLWPTLYETRGSREAFTWDAWFEKLTCPLVLADKTAAPGWSPGCFTGDERKDEATDVLTALVIEYDGTDTLDAAEETWADYYGLLVTTYSHTEGNPHFRVILPFTRAVTPADYERIWAWANHKTGCRLDSAAQNPSRLWFLSSTPPGGAFETRRLTGAFLNPDDVLSLAAPAESGALLEPDSFLAEAFKLSGLLLRGLSGRRWAVVCPWEEEHSTGKRGDTSTILYPPRAGSNTGWFKCAHAHCQSRAVRDVLQKLPPEATRGARQKFPPDKRAEDDNAIDVNTRLSYGEKGLHQTVNNAVALLSYDAPWRGVLGYDEFTDKIRFVKEPPLTEDLARTGSSDIDPSAVTDADVLRVQCWLDRRWKLRVPKGVVDDAISVVAERQRVNPQRAYLDKLAWDGVPRARTWLSRYMGADDNEYTQKCGLWWLQQAVGRALEPGCKADYVLIFVGAQRGGKSAVLRALAKGWFSDDVGELGTKDSFTNLRGKWIIEIAELDDFDKTSDNARKRFFAKQSDQFRPAYARRPVDLPRRCVFAGTTNNYTFLTDPTGNSRYWPVLVGKIDINAFRADVDQLWAEVVAGYEPGLIWYPTSPHERHIFARAQQTFMSEDPWLARIYDYLYPEIEADRPDAARGRGYVTVEQVLGQVVPDRDRWSPRETDRCIRMLAKLGWTVRQEKLGKGTRTVYCRPEEQEP